MPHTPDDEREALVSLLNLLEAQVDFLARERTLHTQRREALESATDRGAEATAAELRLRECWSSRRFDIRDVSAGAVRPFQANTDEAGE